MATTLAALVAATGVTGVPDAATTASAWPTLQHR